MHILLQRNIPILRTNIATANTSAAIQRSKTQKKHVQITLNVVVFMMLVVVIIHGL